MLRFVPLVTIGAFGGCRMRKTRGQYFLDAAMTRGAELALPGGQERAVVRGVGRMADQALAVYGRHVAGSAGATRGVVTVEAEAGAGGRSDKRLVPFVAAVAGELGMNRCPKQFLAGRTVGWVSGFAVHPGH